MNIHDVQTDRSTSLPETSLATRSPSTVIGLIGEDLPCPWCGEATQVADASCRGCGRRFG
jgi:predicted RNA-binding Zn-ribbon protein involved in translation (DUF1610 family)